MTGRRYFDHAATRFPKPAIVLDGEVVGTWSRKVKGSRMTVALELFRGLGKTQLDAGVPRLCPRFDELRPRPQVA